jgi:iron complex outermembrane receptor protein
MAIISHSTSDKVAENAVVRRIVAAILRSSALPAACVISGSLLSLGALAQQAPPAPAGESELQEIVVTGSMIKRPNAETAEAITILKADVLKDQGIVNVEQAINTLTSANPSVNIASVVGTFSGGGTFANLRGLGNGRTLVLLDGDRLSPNAANGLGVDLGGIPFSAIDSVEVLREGASALYGSDAIAGVINFKTKKNYQGGQIQANFDRPQGSGGSSGSLDFTFGHGDLASDGYNFMITASYTRQEELQAGERGFSAQGFDPAAGITATNFPGSWPGVVLDNNGNLFQSGYPGCAGNPQLTTFFGDCSYRYSAATDLLPESHEVSGLVSFTKKLSANNQLQLQYFYTTSENNGYSGPVFYFFQMNPTSPYFPTASSLVCQRGPANCGGLGPDLTDPISAIWSDPNNNRYGGTVNTEQRIVATFSGNSSDWDYSASFNWSKNHNDNRWTGGIPNESLLAPGGILSNLINPFGPQSAAGQSLINSSYISGTYLVGDDTRWSLDGHISHPLGDAFNAGAPATVALGATVNGERFTAATTPYNDLVSAATGLTDSSVEGSRLVQAAFLEVDVPISKGLDLDISDRQDRYSDFGSTNNAKIQMRFQPASFLTFRGTASTGFRAPTLFNLYSPPFLAASSSGSMGQGNPFCSPGNYTVEWSQSTCLAQGIGLFGGNTHLTAESSQNFDFGVIVSPFQDMGITLDYYRILVKNTIGGVPPNAIYGNPTAFANYIVTATSGPFAGTLPPTIAESSVCQPYTATSCGYINQEFSNTGRITTDGIDLSIQYQQQTSIGTFREDLEGTAVTQFLQQQYTGGPTLNLVGNLQIQGLNPAFRWQHNVRVDWASPEKTWGAGLSDRFWAGYVDEFTDGNGNLRKVGSYSLVDGYVSVKPMEKLAVLVGIKNILNTSPPLTNASQNNFASGYNALIADPLLRNFYVNLKYTF